MQGKYTETDHEKWTVVTYSFWMGVCLRYIETCI